MRPHYCVRPLQNCAQVNLVGSIMLTKGILRQMLKLQVRSTEGGVTEHVMSTEVFLAAHWQALTCIATLQTPGSIVNIGSVVGGKI